MEENQPHEWYSPLEVIQLVEYRHFKRSALSSTEAEYIALPEAVKEGVWLKRCVEELGLSQDSVEVYCDSQSAITLSKNDVFHERTKHVATKYHFIWDLINAGEVRVLKIATTNNPADIFTKVLLVYKLREALKMLQVTKDWKVKVFWVRSRSRRSSGKSSKWELVEAS